MAVVVVPMSGRRSGMAVVIVTVIGRRSGMAMIVMPMLGRCRMGRMGVLTVSGVRSVTGTMAVICAVIAVRLVLVTHCYSVPRPLFAVFTAKSV
jgi:hypothetical protein